MVAEPAAALLALWNDVAAGQEVAYEEWHSQEHVPERCTVPGILWGRRYEQTRQPRVPRYLTLYGLRDAQVLQGEPYQRLLREPTRASRAMRANLQRVSRWVCRVHRSDSVVDSAAHLLVATRAEAPNAPELRLLLEAASAEGCLLAERLRDAAPLPWLQSGQDCGIEGGWLLCLAVDGQPGTVGSTLADAVAFRRLPVADRMCRIE